MSHRWAGYVGNVEVRWGTLDRGEVEAVLLMTDQEGGMRSAPAKTAGEALKDLHEQVKAADTTGRKRKLWSWRSVFCVN